MGLELLHLSYVKRWVVAPTHREQSVAEHSYRVAIIAMHLAMALDRTEAQIHAVTVQALYHDADERLSGDIPGPVKSAEAGYLRDLNTMSPAECIVKVADSIETGTFWLQWGNKGAWSGHPYNRAPARDIDKINHYAAKIPGLLEAACEVWEVITGDTTRAVHIDGQGNKEMRWQPSTKR